MRLSTVRRPLTTGLDQHGSLEANKSQISRVVYMCSLPRIIIARSLLISGAYSPEKTSIVASYK